MNYRLTIFPALEAENPSIEFLFNTINELDAAGQTAANLLLFMQNEAKVMDDYSNMFQTEQLINGEWQDFQRDEYPESAQDAVNESYDAAAQDASKAR